MFREDIKDPPPTNAQPERYARELLRENLNTIALDVFYLDDPVMKMVGEERKEYLKYFYELSKSPILIDRIKYMINKQAVITLSMPSKGGVTDSVFDMAGSLNINGMSSVKDTIDTLATMYKKEYLAPEQPINKQGI